MKILFVSVEMSPYAKVGGLADVAGSLPEAMSNLGHDVRTVMPLYKLIETNPKFKLKSVSDDLKVSLNNWWHKRARIAERVGSKHPAYFVGTDEWFCDVDKSEKIYAPPVDAYLFFAKAVLRMCEELNWIPDVIHCNDWHTGMIPVLLREQSKDRFASTASLFTIHNLAYQGEFGIEVLDKLGLSHDLFDYHRLETFGSVNFLKSGSAYSEMTNTVSQTYASEIQTPEFGCRLEGFMQYLAENSRLHGILNGIDYDEWNPATDQRIASNFDADHPAEKAKCREALFSELSLEPIENAPIAGVVSRLSDQKGMDLILAAAPELFAVPLQIVVQGLGDPWLADEFRKLEKRFPKNFRFVQKFDIEIAQKIYSGSDLFLMPSAFEPCGLGQLIAMRYGTIPVVRSTGGLQDTIFEAKNSLDFSNGFVFENKNLDEFQAAVHRAIQQFSNKSAWESLIENAMRSEHSWSASATKYEQLYMGCILSRRNREALAS